MQRLVKSLLLFLLFCFIIPSAVQAKSGLQVEAEIGFENRVKADFPTVLTVTVTNNGDTFSGDLVVDIPASYQVGSAIVVPLDIASGETKTIPVYLEGYYDGYNYGNQTTQMFTFYEGGIEKGKKVGYSGDKSVSPRVLSPAAKMILVLTTRQDEISAIEDLRKATNDEVVTYYTASKNDPYLVTDYRGLSHIDVIVFDDIAVQDLSNQQQEAIYKWVQQGGKVAFSPTEFVKNGAGIFKDVLPLSLQSEMKAVPKDLLKQYADIDSINSDILIYSSTIAEGSQPTFQMDGNTFAAQTNVGRGKVIQFAYPLYDPVITNFKNYGQLVSVALKSDNSSNYITPILSASNWSYTNELFETFNINAWALLGGILVYMLIIGPVLYIFLKRKDQRGKMWVVLPILAVITSLGIFIVGAKDRILSPQMEQMALYEISEDGTMNGTFLNSMLSNKSGNFTFTMDENTTALSNANSNGNIAGIQKSYVKDTAEGKKLTLRDVNYWSVQSVVGETIVQDVGGIVSDLKVENQRLIGTITSTLPIDLKDAKILASYDEYEIGTIKAGETVQVAMDIKKNFLIKPSNYSVSNGYNPGQIDLLKEKFNLLKSTAIDLSGSKNTPLLVGWSDISLAPIELKGGSKQNTISYFVKPLSIKVEVADEIILTNVETSAEIIQDNNSWGYIEDVKANTAYISEGKVSIVYKLVLNDTFKTAKWKELEVKYKDDVYTLEIVNATTGEVIELKDGSATITENVDQLVNKDLQIQFNIKRIGMDDGMQIILPTFTLKGEPVK